MNRYTYLSNKENLTQAEAEELEGLEYDAYLETQYSVRAWANGGM